MFFLYPANQLSADVTTLYIIISHIARGKPNKQLLCNRRMHVYSFCYIILINKVYTTPSVVTHTTIKPAYRWTQVKDLKLGREGAYQGVGVGGGGGGEVRGQFPSLFK